MADDKHVETVLQDRIMSTDNVDAKEAAVDGITIPTVSSKGLKTMNAGENPEQAKGGIGASLEGGGSESSTEDESSEVDEDFVAGEDVDGSADDDSGDDDDDDDGEFDSDSREEQESVPTTGFLYFCEAEREKIKKENPAAGYAEYMRIIGEKWRNMPDAEREPYEAKALADKKRSYGEAGGHINQQYTNDGDFVNNENNEGSPDDDSEGDEEEEEDDRLDSDWESDGPNSSKKQKRVLNAPAIKITTSFVYFSRAELEIIKRENPGIKFTDAAKIIGEKWRNMSAAEREPYEAKYRADAKRQLDQVSGYKRQQSANVRLKKNSDCN